MAIGIPVSLGTASAASAGTTITLTFGSAVAVGDTVILFVGCDTTGKTVSTIVDTRSNTWATDATSNATQPAGAYIISTVVSTGIQVSDTVVVTLSGSTADRMIAGISVTGMAASSILDKASAAAQGTATSWSSAATAVTANANDLVVGLAVENDSALLTGVTSSAGWTKIHDFGNSDGVYLTSQYQIVSATAAYTATGTWAGTGVTPRWQALAAAYKGADTTPVTVAWYTAT